MDGRFWGQNNIDFIISDDETIVDYNYRRKEYGIQKSGVGVSRASAKSTNVFMASSNVCP